MAITVDKTTNVIKITGTTSAANTIDLNEVNIQAIKWIGDDIADGSIVEIQNTNGDTVWKAIGITLDTGVFETFPFGLRAKGLKSDNVDAGEIYIYYA